ncbi:hypothetical protein BGZ76_008237, partial [Entomortierella beljakovae]
MSAGSPKTAGSPIVSSAQSAGTSDTPTKGGRRKRVAKKELSTDPSSESASAPTPGGQYSVPATPAADAFASPNISHVLQVQPNTQQQVHQIAQHTSQLAGQPNQIQAHTQPLQQAQAQAIL